MLLDKHNFQLYNNNLQLFSLIPTNKKFLNRTVLKNNENKLNFKLNYKLMEILWWNQRKIFLWKNIISK